MLYAGLPYARSRVAVILDAALTDVPPRWIEHGDDDESVRPLRAGEPVPPQVAAALAAHALRAAPVHR